MIIIAHRAQDYKKEIPQRFGVEIDVYNHGGVPLMGHSPTENSDESLSWWIYEDIHESGERPVYALNIKADGMEEALEKQLKGRPITWIKSFCFDGSHPTMRRLKNLHVQVAERISEEEPYRGHSHIIWLDRWDWVDGEGPVPGRGQTATGKICNVPLISQDNIPTEIYAVSPELHIPNCQPSFRNYWWRRFQEMGCAGICTDHWLECEEFLK